MPLPQVHDMNLDKYNIKIRMKVNPCYYYLKKKKIIYTNKQTIIIYQHGTQCKHKNI